MSQPFLKKDIPHRRQLPSGHPKQLGRICNQTALSISIFNAKTIHKNPRTSVVSAFNRRKH